MIEQGAAECFARDWIAAWNEGDLEAVLSHYAEDVEFHSPRVAQVTKGEQGVLRGRAALESYLRAALKDAPDLKYVLERVYSGRDSVSIAYRNHRNQCGVETLVFDSHGRVRFSVTTYCLDGPAPGP